MTIKMETKGNDAFLKESGRLTFFAKVANLGRDSYGLELEGYEDGRLVFFVSQKSWATSLLLQATLQFVEFVDGKMRLTGEEDCNDPRVLMTHILAGRLMLMEYWAGYDENCAEKEINQVLPNPTIAEAQEWLRNNGFGGRNRRKSRDSRSAPGWSIAHDDYDLVDLPPDTEKLYSKYKKLWKETKIKEDEGE